jgi:hypothetical protein
MKDIFQRRQFETKMLIVIVALYAMFTCGVITAMCVSAPMSIFVPLVCAKTTCFIGAIYIMCKK